MVRAHRKRTGRSKSSMEGLAVLAVACVLAAACEREEVRSYRVAKEVPVPGGAMGATGAASSGVVSGGSADGTGGGSMAERRPEAEAEVAWVLPAGWKDVPSEQPMRLATFDADGIEVALSAFPGSVGGDLANVNRWRGQLGLAPIGQAQLEPTLARRRVGGSDVATLVIEGSDGQAMLAAIVVPGDGKTWFVKSMLDAAKVGAMRPGFDAFADSIQRGAGSGSGMGGTGGPASAEAASSNRALDTAASTLPAGSIDAALRAFVPPAHWTVESQSGGIVAAAYSASNGGGGARITATSLSGDGGGDLANINRWRGQLGLSPAATLGEVGAIDLGIGDAGTITVDLANAEGSDRMIASIVRAGGETWFFKLRGAVAGVEAERGEFATFVRAVARAGGGR
ncbi:MAG: hypothetical protein RL136_599 [Planctomycetota bacterium]